MTTPSVFQLAKPTKKKISRAMEIDPDLLKIEHNTPIPKGRPAPGKYDELFASLKAGSCVACEPAERGNVESAIMRWMRRNKITGMKTVKRLHCDDGKARIWIVKVDHAAD